MKVVILSVLCSAAAAFSSFTPRMATSNTVSNGSNLSMKIYDWKRRTADESVLPDTTSFDNLRSAPGSRKRKNRKSL